MTFKIGTPVVSLRTQWPDIIKGDKGKVVNMTPLVVNWDRNGLHLRAIPSSIAPASEKTTTNYPVQAQVADRVLADDNRREEFPLYDGLLAYFPAALCEVARWSKVGGAKHTPGEPLHWKREASTDHENKILRHLLDADKEIDDGFIEAVALAWRSLALCQTLLEKRGWAEGANARWKR